jgi:hypothetical protein
MNRLLIGVVVWLVLSMLFLVGCRDGESSVSTNTEDSKIPDLVDGDQAVILKLVFKEKYGVDFKDAAKRLFKEKYEAEFEKKKAEGRYKGVNKEDIITREYGVTSYDGTRAYIIVWGTNGHTPEDIIVLDPIGAYAIDDDGNLFDVIIEPIPGTGMNDALVPDKDSDG